MRFGSLLQISFLLATSDENILLELIECLHNFCTIFNKICADINRTRFSKDPATHLTLIIAHCESSSGLCRSIRHLDYFDCFDLQDIFQVSCLVNALVVKRE